MITASHNRVRKLTNLDATADNRNLTEDEIDNNTRSSSASIFQLDDDATLPESDEAPVQTIVTPIPEIVSSSEGTTTTQPTPTQSRNNIPAHELRRLTEESEAFINGQEEQSVSPDTPVERPRTRSAVAKNNSNSSCQNTHQTKTNLNVTFDGYTFAEVPLCPSTTSPPDIEVTNTNDPVITPEIDFADQSRQTIIRKITLTPAERKVAYEKNDYHGKEIMPTCA